MCKLCFPISKILTVLLVSFSFLISSYCIISNLIKKCVHILPDFTQSPSSFLCKTPRNFVLKGAILIKFIIFINNMLANGVKHKISTLLTSTATLIVELERVYHSLFLLYLPVNFFFITKKAFRKKCVFLSCRLLPAQTCQR